MGARHNVSAPTHNVTHISKSSGGHSGNDRIIFSSKPVQTVPLGHKSTLALCATHLHTHEATGSSPVVSTKTRQIRMDLPGFLLLSALFRRIYFRAFGVTHAVTHTGIDSDRTGQHRTGFYRPVLPLF